MLAEHLNACATKLSGQPALSHPSRHRCGCGNLLERALGALDVVFAHLFDQGGALQIQALGGLGINPVRVFQGSVNQVFFDARQVILEINVAHREVHHVGGQCGQFLS